MKNFMKICYVANGINLPYKKGEGSGSSTHVYEVTKWLQKKGNKVCVVCSRLTGEVACEDLQGITIYRMFWSGGPLHRALTSNRILWLIAYVPYYIIKTLVEIISLGMFITRHSIDLVYERNSTSSGIRSLLYLVLRKPMVLEVNDFYFDPIALHTARFIITPNKTTLPTNVLNKVKELPWGTNNEVFRPNIEKNRFFNAHDFIGKNVVLLVCSALPWHGIEETIDAACIILKKRDDVIFIVVGGGDHIKKYQDKAEQCMLGRRFVFTGPVPYSEVPSYISAAHITLAPYNSQLTMGSKNRHLYASSLKVFEYMACGKAVVITCIGNVNNLIEDGKTGLVIKEDSSVDLALAIERLLDDKAYRDALGRKAREAVEKKYSWDIHTQELCFLFGMAQKGKE